MRANEGGRNLYLLNTLATSCCGSREIFGVGLGSYLTEGPEVTDIHYGSDLIFEFLLSNKASFLFHPDKTLK